MTHGDRFSLLIIFVLSLLALLPLFQPGFMGYDFVYQGARLAAFYQNLKEGVILPRWAGGPINAGFGHPVLIFLYPFVFYLASFWHALGFCLVDSLKILFGLSYLFSGIFAYLFFKKLSHEKAALAAALLYQFIPFRFLNLYGRAALGEHLAVTFLPLVFLAILKIFQTQSIKLKDIILLGVVVALTILSHNLIFILALPLIIIFVVYLFLKFKLKDSPKKLLFLAFSFLLGLSLSAFFWFPLLFERKYIRYDEIANPNYFWHNGILPLYQIFIPPNYFKLDFLDKATGDAFIYPSISPGQWLVFILGVIFLFKFRKKAKAASVFVAFLLFYFLLGALMSTKAMFWLVAALPQIAFVQQAFRFLNLPLFATPLLFLFIVKLWQKSYLLPFLVLFTLFNLLLNLPFLWNLKIPRQFKDDRYFFEEYAETADTGQITPRWSLINYFEAAPQKVQLVSGGLDRVEIKKWHSQEHLYSLTLRENSQVADNTLYFPGWTVYVDGQKAPLDFQDMNWRGIITYPVPAGTHQIKVKFKETKIRQVGDYISLGSFFFMMVVLLFDFLENSKVKMQNSKAQVKSKK